MAARRGEEVVVGGGGVEDGGLEKEEGAVEGGELCVDIVEAGLFDGDASGDEVGFFETFYEAHT